MASLGHETSASVTTGPERLSRYRSTRKAQTQQNVPEAPVPPSPNPASTGTTLEHPNAPNGQSTQSQVPAPLQNESIQRSMSRYRKPQKPKASIAQPPSLAPMPAQPGEPSATRAQANGTLHKAPTDHTSQGAIKSDTDERKSRGAKQDDHNRIPRPSQEQSVPSSAQVLENSSAPLTHSKSAPGQATRSSRNADTSDAMPLQSSRSRYRRQDPANRENVSRTRSNPHARNPLDTLPATLKQEHREAIRRIQKQASFPSPNAPAPAQVPQPRLLTKASLDQIPDANKDDNENYFNQMKAITRHTILNNRNDLDMPRAAPAHASRAQNEVKMMMDAEVERQRRMQEKIRSERERAKADELAQTRAQQERAEQLAAERLQREEQQRLAKAAVDSLLRERKEAEKAENEKKTLAAEQPLPARRHQRKESKEERTQRHRNRSLSALEGSEGLKIASPDDPGNEPSAPPVPKEPLGFLKKKRADNEPASKDVRETNGKHDKQPKEEVNIRPGGGGIVPGVDAPISAVNAGERRVMVECNKSSIYLPVTTTTTPAELIQSAATCLNESINAKASVLLESFGKVGVQRPLRMYEHIRSVMNSWDDDRQNSLVLVPSATGGNDVDLESTSVVAEQPDEISFSLHYSQRPGKWEKRWVTLRSDGQVVSAKNAAQKDIVNVCHMSDFDIYTPSEQQLTKKIKPPKKLCFAIKSQQKSAMFLSTENFIHFFCTGDKQTAAEWYRAVQGWRSWYLVNIMGEGEKPPRKKDPKTGAPILPDIVGTDQNKPGSRDSHYQLGSFKPLLDFSAFGLDSEAPAGVSNESQTTGSSHNRNGPSKSSTANVSSFSKPITQGSAEDDTFSPTGLLGRNYSTRQKPIKDRELGFSSESPFTGGLLESVVRPSMDQGRPNVADLNRSSSNARRGKPLRDLASGKQDSPQHGRKGQGLAPDHVGASGLVESATGPDLFSLSRSRSGRRPHEQAATPFTGEGLLGSAPAGQGGLTTGRGVMDGSKVRVGQGMGPMLDMNAPSTFAERGLLRQVEAKQGPQQPVIERA